MTALFLFLLLPLVLTAANGPQWWTDLGVLSGSPSNDYAAINQGQLKNLAVQAYAHIKTYANASVWTTPQGVALTSLVNGFQSNPNTSSNYKAVNLGQLKNVAKPFYDVLMLPVVAYATHYPWSGGNVPAAKDYAIANIGQAKNLFSFDLSHFSPPGNMAIVSVQFPQYYAHVIVNPMNGANYMGGVIPVQNWNVADTDTGTSPASNASLVNSTGGALGSSILMSSTGGSTTVTFTYSGYTRNDNANTGAGYFPSPIWYLTGGFADAYIAVGSSFNLTGVPETLTVSGLNASHTYELITYVTAPWWANNGNDTASVSAGGTTYYIQTSNTLGAWTQATSTLSGSPTVGNYVEFNNLTGSTSQAVTITGAYVGLAGFQLIDLGSTGGGTTYTLTVNGGSGSGTYTAGTVVNVTAAAPAYGYQFAAWTGSISALADSSSASTTLTMPAVDISITATYTPNSILPAAPTGLTAIAGNGQASLSWTASTGASSYNLYRGTSTGGESATPIATGLSSTSFIDTGLTNGTTYYYKVKAVNTSGISDYSSEVSANLTVGIPSTPIGLIATAGNGQVNLSWSASTGALNYNIYRGTSPGGENATPIATGISTAIYTDTSVANFTTYYYKVVAVSASGTSNYSAEVYVTPQVPTGSPTTYYQDSFSRTGELNGTQPDLINTNHNHWTVSTGAGAYSTNGSTVFDHNVVYDAAYLPVNGSSGVILDGTANFTLSATVMPDSNGFWYGISLNTATIPAGGNISSYGLAEVLLSYGSVGCNNDNGYAAACVGGTPLTYVYNIYAPNTSYSISLVYDALAGQIVFTANNSVIYTLSGVIPSQIASLRAVAFGNGNSSSKATLDNFTLTVASTGIAAAPIGLAAQADDGQVHLSWTASAGATSYNVYRGTTPGGESTTPIATGITTTSFNDVGLNGKTYYYKVAANNAKGTSDYSNEVGVIPTGVISVQFPQYYADSIVSPMNTGNYTGGVIPVQNWNVADTDTGTSPANNASLVNSGGGLLESCILINSSGDNTGLSFTFAGYTRNDNASTGTSGFPTPLWYQWGASADGYLATGSSFNETGTPETLTVLGLDPSHAYNLIVYVTAPWWANNGSENASVSAGGTTYYIKTSNTLGTWTQATSTTLGSPTTANYVLFGNLNGSNIQTVTLSGTYVGLAGFQVVDLGNTGGGLTYALTVNSGAGSGHYAAGTVVAVSANIPASGYQFANWTGATTNMADPSAASTTFTMPAAAAAITCTYTTSAPIAPIDLTAVAGNAQVSLSWTASAGATSYNVYRGTSSGGENATAVATNISSTSYSDVGLVNGITYYYKVKAVNALVTSDYSNEANAAPSIVTTDTIPDWWQLFYFGSLGINPDAFSQAGDGYTNFEEYLLGRDPLYSGQNPAPTPGGTYTPVPTDRDPSNPSPQGAVPPPSSITISPNIDFSSNPSRLLSVTVSWSAPSKQIYSGFTYQVDRKFGNGNWVTITTTPGLSYIDGTIMPSSRVHYRVRCVLSNVQSTYIEAAYLENISIVKTLVMDQIAVGSKPDYTEFENPTTPIPVRYTTEVDEESDVDGPYYELISIWTPTSNTQTGNLDWKLKSEGYIRPNYTVDMSPTSQTTEEGSDESRYIKYTRSVPYTTDELKAAVIASLPAWSDWHDGGYTIAGRNLATDETQFSIHNVTYKYQFSTIAQGYTYNWAEVYIKDVDPDNPTSDESRTKVTPRSCSAGGLESPQFTINAGKYDENGSYYLTAAPQLSVDDGLGGVLDQSEKASSGARVSFGAPNTVSSTTFTISNTGISGVTYSLSESGGSSIQIYAVRSDSGGIVLAPTSFNAGDYTSFIVVATGEKYNDQSILVNLEARGPDGTVISSDSSKFYYAAPPIPPAFINANPDEAAGAKYRKIALNGLPLSDSKPQKAEESDQQAEETFIDALTLGLRHSTTDIYVPIPGSELALSVRRNTQSEVWNFHDGLRAHERPDLPFGVGWNSNLISGIHFIEKKGNNATFVGEPNPDPDEAYVTDENGASYRFAMWTDSSGSGNRRFFPYPTAKNEQAAYLTSLVQTSPTQYVFKRKFGSTLTFDGTPIALKVQADRMAGSTDSFANTYARLRTVTDRLGYTLQYTYQTDSSLVPKTISALDANGTALPNQSIYIYQDANGCVTSIWDPNWNQTQFSYRLDTISYDPTDPTKQEKVWQLVSVTAPHLTSDNATTVYSYSSQLEQDLTPRYPVQNFCYIHYDVASIQDPNGNIYKFDYALDQSRENYKLNTQSNINTYYPATGRPRTVKSVTLPSGDIANFENQSLLKLTNDVNGNPVIDPSSKRVSVITDAVQNKRTYTWPIDKAIIVKTTDFTKLYGWSRSFGSNAQNMVLYKEMQIQYGDDQSLKEIFDFDENAGLNVKSVKDLSGNTTFFAYTDTWNIPPSNPYRLVLPANSGINGVYEDPTSQTNALGISKTFTYDPSTRIMSGVVDENGHCTQYGIDSLGRRTSEIIKTSTNGTIIKSTQFGYGNNQFPGFMTACTISALAGDSSGATSIVTQYIPDTDGRIAQEIVDPNGLKLTTSYIYDQNGNKLTVQDPNKHTTKFVYDQRNRLIEVHYPTTDSGVESKYIAYDSRGNKIKEIDENGHATLYAYDSLNRIYLQARDMNGNQTIDSGDLITKYGYNAVNSKTSITDPNGNIAKMAVDSLQRLISTTTPPLVEAPAGYTTTYSYNLSANAGGNIFDSSSFKPTSILDPRGYLTTVTYDVLYRPVAKSVRYDASNTLVTRTEYDNVGNATATTVDNPSQRTETDYDALNRPIVTRYGVISNGAVNSAYGSTQIFYTGTGLKWKVRDELWNSIDPVTKKTLDPRAHTTETHYDTAGRPTDVLASYVDDGTGTNTSTSSVTTTGYDAAGNVAYTINPLKYRWDFAYDVRNRKTDELQPLVTDFSATPPASSRPHIHTSYDAVGNVIAVTDARGNTTQTDYDFANRKVKITAPSVPMAGGGNAQPLTRMAYDANGNICTLTDSNNNVTTNNYDSLNRLVTTIDAAGIAVVNKYDEVGNRVAVLDGKAQKTQFAYDGLNRLVSTTDPAGASVTFQYDALNKTSRVDSLNQTTGYGYDLRNRLTTVTYSGRTADNRFYNYDLVGNLTSVTQSNTIANVGYSYDALNRQVTETSGGLTHNYVYDLAGNRLTTTYGGTLQVLNSSYDALNRLSTLTETTPGVSGTRTSTYTYDLNGNIYQKVLPNGDAITSAYDALNRTSTLSGTAGSGSTLYNYAYAYDLLSNVKTITETYPGGTGSLNNRTVANTYDPINRLTTEAITSAGSTTTTGYAYDNAHNRTSKTLTIGTGTPATTTYSYNQLNQLTTTTAGDSYGYDLNGNRTTHTLSGLFDTYGYDYENRLVTLTKSITGQNITTGTYKYAYDYRTRRILRDESANPGGVSTKLVFSGGTSVQEYDNGANTPTVTYLRGSDYGGGIGGILYTLRGTNLSYTHENRRGDVIAKTGSTGSLTYQAAYEAFGKRTQEQGATSDRQKANTKDEDPTGLLNEGFRYRDLDTGTFITRDPLGFVDGPNMYAYVVCNPWTKFDPEGLKFDDKQFDSEKNHMKHKPVDENASEQDRKNAEAYNNRVDKFNENLDKLRSTPSGSALYEKLKSDKETITINLIENNSDASNVPGSSTTMNINLNDKIIPTSLFAMIGHEMTHVWQHIEGRRANIEQPHISMLPAETFAEFNKRLVQKIAETVGEEFGLDDKRDDYTAEFSSTGRAYWHEQQAVRMQNRIAAEYAIAHDPSQTFDSVAKSGLVRDKYTNVDERQYGYPSLNGNLYGTIPNKNP